MNQSLKSILALIILVCLGATVLGWTTRGIGGVPESQFWLRMAGIPIIPALALLIWADFRKDRVPDLLRKNVRRYFEREGLCFAVVADASDGQFSWKILFQNRYDRPRSAHIAFRPAAGFLPFNRAKMDEVYVKVDCDGGAYGSATVPFALPPEYLGRKLKFEILAETEFPAGRGKMLRFRDGVHVGNRYKSGADTALMALSGLTGHLHVKKQATFVCRLPEQASSESGGQIVQEILWRPSDAKTMNDASRRC